MLKDNPKLRAPAIVSVRHHHGQGLETRSKIEEPFPLVFLREKWCSLRTELRAPRSSPAQVLDRAAVGVCFPFSQESKAFAPTLQEAADRRSAKGGHRADGRAHKTNDSAVHNSRLLLAPRSCHPVPLLTPIAGAGSRMAWRRGLR